MVTVYGKASKYRRGVRSDLDLVSVHRDSQVSLLAFQV